MRKNGIRYEKPGLLLSSSEFLIKIIKGKTIIHNKSKGLIITSGVSYLK